jgi:hypothetical protein
MHGEVTPFLFPGMMAYNYSRNYTKYQMKMNRDKAELQVATSYSLCLSRHPAKLMKTRRTVVGYLTQKLIEYALEAIIKLYYSYF